MGSHLSHYRVVSNDLSALEALNWLIEKGDTNTELWKSRAETEMTEDLKLKEQHKYDIYNRFSEVAFSLQMGILSQSIYQSVPDQPVAELDWDTINNQQSDFKIEVIADSAESGNSGEDLSKA